MPYVPPRPVPKHAQGTAALLSMPDPFSSDAQNAILVLLVKFSLMGSKIRQSSGRNSRQQNSVQLFGQTFFIVKARDHAESFSRNCERASQRTQNAILVLKVGISSVVLTYGCSHAFVAGGSRAE